MKLMEKVKKNHVAISESSVSSPKLIGTTSNYTSATGHKSSDIHKLFPKTPTKCVQILKHIWDQMYRSPRKHKLMICGVAAQV